jgi:hypothetical protein
LLHRAKVRPPIPAGTLNRCAPSSAATSERTFQKGELCEERFEQFTSRRRIRGEAAATKHPARDQTSPSF